ncbi:MAG: hypothetical protein NC394_00020 [Bacteroides sp.]|nr:hypothetical protein [Bacteroides sp.]
MKNILIICTSNKTRSPMAMEIANHIAEKRNAPYTFKSAGMAVVGNNIDENVREVLKEIGIETAHLPTHISQYDIDSFDALHVMTQRQKITLCSYVKNRNIENKITVLGIEDPFYKGIDAYRSVRDRLVEFYSVYIKGESDG